MSAGSLRWRAAVFLLPILALAPFAAKPYQADDHLSIWVAEQIARHPADFFGFDVDYGYARVPIHTISHNPPGTAYWLALLGVISDWNLVVLHLGMSLFAGVAAWGAFELARDLGARPVIASVASVLTPAFLVSASTLMTDMPMVAFYVWAIVAWRRGFARGSWRWMLCASACAALAPMMKFFGITLLPLLVLDGLLRRPRPRRWWGWLAIPVAAFTALQAYTFLRYGVMPFFDAAGVATAAKWRREEHALTRPVLTLLFVGGSFLPLALGSIGRAGAKVAAGSVAISVLAAAPLIDGYSALQLLIGQTQPYSWPVLAHLAVFLCSALLILASAARALAVPSRVDAILLAGWIGGTLLFTIFVNHYVNARALLPMLPALAALLAPGFERLWMRGTALTAGAALCAWLLVADYDVAAHDLRAAQRAIALAKEENVPLHYIAFWGFEYHLMKAGAHPLAFAPKANMAEPTRPMMNPGELLVVDAYAAAPWSPPPKGFNLIEGISAPYSAAATTFDASAAAGFYSHRIGVLPYRVGRVEPEWFLIFEWTGLANTSRARSVSTAEARRVTTL